MTLTNILEITIFPIKNLQFVTNCPHENTVSAHCSKSSLLPDYQPLRWTKQNMHSSKAAQRSLLCSWIRTSPIMFPIIFPHQFLLRCFPPSFPKPNWPQPARLVPALAPAAAPVAAAAPPPAPWPAMHAARLWPRGLEGRGAGCPGASDPPGGPNGFSMKLGEMGSWWWLKGSFSGLRDFLGISMLTFWVGFHGIGVWWWLVWGLNGIYPLGTTNRLRTGNQHL